jgi:hypothetical protein
VKRTKTSNSNIIGWKRGGGFLVFFGSPFLISGLFIMSVPFSGIEVEGNMPEWGLIPFGSIFALVGSGLVFGRMGTILNRSERKLITWWGLLIPFSSKERKLYDFDKVTLTREVRQTDKSSYTAYPIRLSGRGKPATIGETRVYNDSRKVAEDIARFLQLAMEDSSAGATVRREAGSLDDSIRDQVRRTGERIVIPSMPAGMKTKILKKGADTLLEIPAPGFSHIHFLMLAVGLLFPTIVFFVFLQPILNEGMPDEFEQFFVGFIVIFFILLPIITTLGLIASSALKKWRVMVSPTSVKIAESAISVRTHELSADEIEELELNPSIKGAPAFISAKGLNGGGILLRSDSKSLCFGGHLPESELQYLHSLIRSIITS